MRPILLLCSVFLLSGFLFSQEMPLYIDYVIPYIDQATEEQPKYEIKSLYPENITLGLPAGYYRPNGARIRVSEEGTLINFEYRAYDETGYLNWYYELWYIVDGKVYQVSKDYIEKNDRMFILHSDKERPVIGWMGRDKIMEMHTLKIVNDNVALEEITYDETYFGNQLEVKFNNEDKQRYIYSRLLDKDIIKHSRIPLGDFDATAHGAIRYVNDNIVLANVYPLEKPIKGDILSYFVWQTYMPETGECETIMNPISSSEYAAKLYPELFKDMSFKSNYGCTFLSDCSIIYKSSGILNSENETILYELILRQALDGEPEILTWTLTYDYKDENNAFYDKAFDRTFYPGENGEIIEIDGSEQFSYAIDHANNSITYLRGTRPWQLIFGEIK